MKQKWWVRWFADDEELGAFTLYSPWWLVGSTSDERSIYITAVWADDEAEVESILYGCYDKTPAPCQIEISFCEPLTFDPREDQRGLFGWADWMTKYWERGEYRQEE